MSLPRRTTVAGCIRASLRFAYLATASTEAWGEALDADDHETAREQELGAAYAEGAALGSAYRAAQLAYDKGQADALRPLSGESVLQAIKRLTTKAERADKLSADLQALLTDGAR